MGNLRGQFPQADLDPHGGTWLWQDNRCPSSRRESRPRGSRRIRLLLPFHRERIRGALETGIAQTECGGHADRGPSRSRLEDGGLRHDHRRNRHPRVVLRAVERVDSCRWLRRGVCSPPSTARRRTGESCESAHSSRLSDAAVVEQLWNSFSGLGALDRHAIDNGTQTPEQTAELVAARLRAGALTT